MRKTVPPIGQRAPARGGPSPDLNELVVFTRVVQAASFTAAARLLGMPKSTVSRKVSELEERVGTRLLQRTTRKLGLTDAGRIYFGYSERIVAELEEADRALGRLQVAPRGVLRVTSPLSFVMLGPVIADFVKRYPDVQLELLCSDRRVNLIEEGFDLAIRVGRLDDSSLVVRPLGVIRSVLVAAPAYLRRRGTPRTPADLARHSCLAFGGSSTPHVWELRAGAEKQDVRITPIVTLNDFDILGLLVRAGLGIAWMPESTVEKDLREGSISRLLPEWRSDELPLQAVYPTARHLSPKVAAFVAVLIDRLGSPTGGRRP